MHGKGPPTLLPVFDVDPPLRFDYFLALLLPQMTCTQDKQQLCMHATSILKGWKERINQSNHRQFMHWDGKIILFITESESNYKS
jgi:hypothetical protein